MGLVCRGEAGVDGNNGYRGGRRRRRSGSMATMHCVSSRFLRGAASSRHGGSVELLDLARGGFNRRQLSENRRLGFGARGRWREVEGTGERENGTEGEREVEVLIPASRRSASAASPCSDRRRRRAHAAACDGEEDKSHFVHNPLYSFQFITDQSF